MTTATTGQAGRPLAETITDRIPFWDNLQTVAYSVGLGFIAVGVTSALYILIFQARYFGHSLKYSWDHLAQLWHFGAVPGIGHWLVAYSDIGRHVFGRDVPESIVGYALVAMIVVKLQTKQRDKPPLADRVMLKLHMPSRYQGRDTSALQYLLLFPSMLLAALPGLLISSAAVFGGMALAHRYGYHPAWLVPTAGWVPVVIGLAGGNLAGHKPAVKAGDDVQRYFLGKRLAISYAADQVLEDFQSGVISLDNARNKITRMRRADPSALYPLSYRLRYARLLKAHAPVKHYSRASAIGISGVVVILAVLAAYGLYVRHYGVTHGFWMP